MCQAVSFEDYTWKDVAIYKEPDLKSQPQELVDRAADKYKARGHRAMKRLRIIFFEHLNQDEN